MSSVQVRAFAESGGVEPDSVADETLPRLDADMAHVLAVLKSMGWKRLEHCTAQEARALPTLEMAMRRILREPAEDLRVTLEYRLIPGPEGEMRVRLYRPAGEPTGPRPLILYLHDGLFVFGEAEGQDATPRALALRTGASVLAAHYRQAPEHRFPAAHEDAEAAWTWLLQHAEDLGGTPGRAAIVGEGSGANLAVNIAIAAKAAGETLPRHLGLITPMAAMLHELPSHIAHARAEPVGTEALKWAVRKLVRQRDDMHEARLNIAGRSDLAGLPPATVIIAGIDPLRSEGEALADALRRAGVWVDATVYEGVTHGFAGLHQIVNKAMFAQAQLAQNLAMALDA